MVKQINITVSNKVFYAFVFVFAALIISVGVYAFNSGAAPSAMGHSLGEIEVPAGCTDGQVLKLVGGVWTCHSEDVSSVSWNDISGIPAGFADGTDNYAADTDDQQFSLGTVGYGSTAYSSCVYDVDSNQRDQAMDAALRYSCPSGYLFSYLEFVDITNCKDGKERVSYRRVCYSPTLIN